MVRVRLGFSIRGRVRFRLGFSRRVRIRVQIWKYLSLPRSPPRDADLNISKFEP